ncbi:MAG TPA: ATP-binding cassette domain-containing protein, partial [Actinomycetota bacterium]|nr:ATP-binding cassette domain-containing protein [Actinomycetota bacterium]
MGEQLVETDDLSKTYGAVTAVDRVSLTVWRGEVYGFLGPNGAGKSTTIRLLLGFLHPTAGSGAVLGLDMIRDSVEIRRRAGYLPGGIAFWDGSTGERLLDELAALSGRPPIRRADLA